MFRNEEDYIRGINCLCLAAHKTDSSLLAYCFMSNHTHIGVRTENPKLLIKAFMYPYNRYFNQKYGRRGRLGEKEFFQIEIQGLYHLLTAIAYILRNPLHHGVTATPFGYKYSSISSLFKSEFGRFEQPSLMQKKSQYLYLPDAAALPEQWKMDASGLILPESVIDVADMQHQFSTARTFMYYMNRLSGEAWEKEQLQDGINIPPVTLNNIEQGIAYQDIRTMLGNEHGRSNYTTMNDIQLCSEIDNLMGGGSIYRASHEELVRISEYIYRNFHLSHEQIKRCLGGRL